MSIAPLTLPDGTPETVSQWWRGTVSHEADPPSGADATATPEWGMALARAFQPPGGVQLLAATDAHGDIVALLPVFKKAPSHRFAFGSTIALLTELYAGRVALLVRSGDKTAALSLLRQLNRQYPDWGCLEMTLVDDNRETERFLGALRQCVSSIESIPLERSPYIALPGQFDEYFGTLKPAFRTEIRRGERRLREIGALTRRMYTTTAEVDELLDAVFQIERESWKETAGTSITTNPFQERFYRELLPICAASGQLLAAVLYLDGRPVAHKLCVHRDSTAAVLKMSYVEDLKRLYPSTVLLAGYLQDIIERGVRYLDFMGVSDDFKMRWTNLTYGRTKHLIFRSSLLGRLASARHRLAQRLEVIRNASAQG